MNSATKAPTKAHSGSHKADRIAMSVTKEMTAPNAAPWLTPITLGSASGLRKMPWSCVPATASAPPASAATMTRGMRISQTMTRSVSETPVTSTQPSGRIDAATTRTTVLQAMSVLPIETAATATTASNIEATGK